jgi:crotonobetainyl-CoA:carnitine CoA-transferase CaiB-like acyl-CoA transferase
MSLPYAGLQVLEIASSIAGSYCGKLFTDAGADVVKLEPRDGDPLRRWTASGAPLDDGEPGALFQYLNAGKKSVRTGHGASADPSALFTAADLVIVDGSFGWGPSEIRQLSAGCPRLVVVSVSTFGLAGPYAGGAVAANEFVLQAMCGSAASRGLPEGRPLQAGGHIGEWTTGLYAAVASAAMLRRALHTGQGDLIDLSMYEAMISTMGGLAAMSRSVLGDRSPATGRSIELPSIVETADGLVGFCTITRQQFMDFLAMIGRADLIDNEELATPYGRMRRRAEFEAMVSEWARTRSTEEIVELAAAMRIPVAPIGTPETVVTIDHFAERGVFVPTANGRFRAPRPPYRSAALDAVPFGPVPVVGEHSGAVRWKPRPKSGGDTGTPPELPLAGIRVLDLTAFWAGPAATHVLAALGADVIKIEGVRRPDAIRYAGGVPATLDRWWEWGSLFLCYNTNKRGVTLELSEPQGRDVVLRLLGECDLLVENFSPRVMSNLGLDWPALHEANPRGVVVRMPAFGLDGPWRDRVGFAQTMEQASGMAWLTGEEDGPPLIPRGPCDPIAGLHAIFAAIAGLAVREHSGIGFEIESTMVEAALNIAAEPLIEYAAYGRAPHRRGNRGAGAAPQGLYRCGDEDRWVALAVTNDKQWAALLDVLGHPAELDAPEYADVAGRQRAADAIDAVVEAWASGLTTDVAEAQLRAAGVPASRLFAPVDVLADEQLAARGFWVESEHPVVGRIRVPAMPFHLERTMTPWVRTPAPTMGEHNSDVLENLLGLSPDDVPDLERAGLIATRPAGL